MKDLSLNKNIMRTSITLFRNISGEKFPVSLTIENGQNMTQNLMSEINKIEGSLKNIKLWNDEYNFESLKENRILRNKTLKNKNIAGLMINDSKEFSIVLNEEEHLRLQYIKSGYNIEEMYKYVIEMDRNLENIFNYSFDEKMGYLTSNLSHIGTGIRLEVIIHLPMLTLNDKINKLFSHKDKSVFSLEGKYGEKGKAYGSIYLIKNTTTTGISEEELIDEFKNILEYVLQEEEKERRNAIKKYKNEITDKIFRAYGVLKEARILDSIEALDLLSYIRLGVELNILDLELKTIEKAILLSRNSYVREHLDGETNINKINIKRADIIRVVLK